MNEKRICGICGKNPAIGDYCAECQAALDRGAPWALKFVELLQEEANQERRELEHRAYDPAEVVSGEMTAQEVIEAIPDANAPEPFADDLWFRYIDSEVWERIDRAADDQHRRGEKGFSRDDPSDVRRYIVLAVRISAEYHIFNGSDPSYSSPTMMCYVTNVALKRYGQPEITERTFSRDMEAIKAIMLLYGLSPRKQKMRG